MILYIILNMYEIKHLVEDFLVDEISNYSLKDSGKFYVFKLCKKGTNTLKAIDIISEKLGVKQKDIGYAGLKDKNAITSQYISILNYKSLDNNYDFNDIIIQKVGFRDEKLYPGCLKGNKFTIVVRNINTKPQYLSSMINYFGEQRFSKYNAEIGKLIIKQKFHDAILLILETKFDKRLRDLYSKNKNNPISVLNYVGKTTLRIYLHAYQSLLWNKCVDIYKKTNKKNILFPLIGFGIETDALTKPIIDNILSLEDLKLKDFIIRQLPELSLEGAERDVFIDVKNLIIGSLEIDEFNIGMNKCKISFELPKGSYATECIRQMFE
jgi:tRNA pseudouridine13 synthase